MISRVGISSPIVQNSGYRGRVPGIARSPALELAERPRSIYVLGGGDEKPSDALVYTSVRIRGYEDTKSSMRLSSD